jgi:hypothetical protein
MVPPPRILEQEVVEPVTRDRSDGLDENIDIAVIVRVGTGYPVPL